MPLTGIRSIPRTSLHGPYSSRMRSLPFKTLLFDVDGTLIDSNRAHAESWTQALREHGVTVEVDHVRRMIGMGGDKILPAVAHVSEGPMPAGTSPTGRNRCWRDGPGFGRPRREAAPRVSQREAHRPDRRDLRRRSRDQLDPSAAGVDDLIPSRTTKDDARVEARSGHRARRACALLGAAGSRSC